MCNYIDIHTHKPANKNITLLNIFAGYELPNNYSGYWSCGIHPWHLQNYNLDNALVKLQKSLSDKKMLAIGEAGLDKNTSASMEHQELAFRQQIKLSESYNKPLIIHCVKSYNEVLNIRKATRAKQAWVLHGFNGSYELAMQCINENCMLSYGHLLLNENSKAYKQFHKIPLENVFFETDEADISISEIYKTGAQLKNISLETLKKNIYNNFEKIFLKV